MQSLASLMSLKQSDIGNLDDFSDEEEDRRASTGSATVSPTAGGAVTIHVCYLRTCTHTHTHTFTSEHPHSVHTLSLPSDPDRDRSTNTNT